MSSGTRSDRVALLDVNVLLALANPDHAHHELAHDWFADHRSHGWATCATTQNGFVRVLSNAAARAGTFRPSEVLELLRRFCSAREHVFWPDAVSLTDASLFNPSLIRGHRQVSDVYLLGLAKKMGGYLATFDAGIPLSAVVGATRNTIAVISPDGPE
jgi:toxin-antitoxin system PIN domain toxin